MLTRRTFVQTASAAALLTGLQLPTIAGAQNSVMPASRLYQALGVNIHPTWLNTVWGTVDWMSRLLELGIVNTRGLFGHNNKVLSKMQPFFNAGGKHCATVSAGGINWNSAQANIDYVRNNSELADHIMGFEGPNEYNKNHPANWVTNLRDFCQQLHDYVRSYSVLDDAVLVAPSIWKRSLADYQALGDISDCVDRGCIHYYSGNKRPTTAMSGALNDASILAPGKPIWMTETGWMTGGNQPISQRAQAKYTLRNYFDAVGYGVEKIFVYELIDDQKNLFGLCDSGARPKQAFTALKNLTGLFRDDTDGSGSIAFESTPSDFKSFVFAKSDGTFLLVFYLDVDSWSSGLDVETSRDAAITLSQEASQIEVYQPTFDSSPITTDSGTSITVPVADHVTVVKITV